MKSPFIIEQDFLSPAYCDMVTIIEDRYDCTYQGLQQPSYQYYPESPNVIAKDLGCENAKWLSNKKKWVQYKDVDLVGYIWLKDYHETIPLDPSYEVYGGKLEFPVYDFSLLPQRGTLIIFPTGPHFLHLMSPVLFGDLYQIKLNINISQKNGNRFFYQPSNYFQDWRSWFDSVA